MNRPIIIMGAGGHARVLLDLLTSQSCRILGLTSPETGAVLNNIWGIPILGEDDLILGYEPDQIDLVNGIGMMPRSALRSSLYERFKNYGYSFPQVIHSSAVLASHIHISAGVQIMAGVVIQTGVQIGENSIINTRAAIDHDVLIGKHVHLAPGTTVSGGASIGEGTFVGAGSTIIQGINISAHCIIGAGAVVISDVPEGSRMIGIPARVR